MSVGAGTAGSSLTLPGQCVAASDIERLRSRLIQPSLPANVVLRPRLMEHLAAGAEGQLTTLVAPAGWGKTTLLASWQRSGDPPAPVAWVRLDRRYDPAGFWWHVAAAMADVIGSSRAGEPATERTDWTPAAILSEFDARVILIIDDCHHIASADVWAGIDELLTYQPRGLHLVISGRSQPHVALHRLRAADELTELGTGELALSVADVAEMFSEYGLDIPRTTMAALVAQLEGWPAGLRLAARRAHNHADPATVLASLSEPNSDIADYVSKEMLQPLPRKTREQVVQLSVLDPFNEDLARAVTAGQLGTRALERLHNDHALTERFGASGGWFRIRPVLRAVLQTRFESLDWGTRKRIHSRAARWYGSHDMPERAIHHWLCAKAWAAAGQVVIDHLEGLVSLADAAPWEAKPAPTPGIDVLHRQHPLRYAVAAARVHRGDLLGADAVLDLPADGQTPAWYDSLASVTLRLTMARRGGDADAMVRYADALVELSSSVEANRPGSGHQVAALAHISRAEARLWQGQFSDAGQDLALLTRMTSSSGLTALFVAGSAWRALLAVLERRLGEAVQLAQSALAAAGNYPTTAAAIRGPAHTALAAVQTLRGSHDSAEHWRLAAQSITTDPLLRVALALLEAWQLVSTGDAASSNHVLKRVHREHGTVRLPKFLHEEATMLEVESLAAQGLLAAARSRFARVAPEPQTPRGRLTEARLLYSEHAVQSALDVVVDSMDTAEAARPDLVIDMMLLKAQLSYLLSRPIDASVALEAACELAAAEDIRQPFIVSGTALRPIMREHLGRGTAHRAFISDLLSLQAEAHPASQSRSQVAEPLTQRERRVLWYLPSRLSNTEIAADMYVSLNTVKTHIKNVYRKLGVNGRREAVARARQLNLL